jgi:hypothetical protein
MICKLKKRKGKATTIEGYEGSDEDFKNPQRN